MGNPLVHPYMFTGFPSSPGNPPMSKNIPSTVHYHVTVNPNTHALNVKIHMAGPVVTGEQLLLTVPTWVPGHYNFMPLAHNISSITAINNTTGSELKVTREGWQGYRIHAPNDDITIRYVAYACAPEFGEPSDILDSHYAVLLGTRYLYSQQHLGNCFVTYHLPKAWNNKIHHPLGAERIAKTTWQYPSHKILLDTPIVIGNFDSYKRSINNTPIHFVFIDSSVSYQQKVSGFVDELVKIVEFFYHRYGAFPFQDYTFVMSLNPKIDWGLEHLTSTMCGLAPDVFTNPEQYQQGIRVCAHKMFHTWNVRRLRPPPFVKAGKTGTFH